MGDNRDQEDQTKPMTFEERMVGHVFAIITSVAAACEMDMTTMSQDPDFKQIRISCGCLIAQPLADLNRLAGAAERIADVLEQNQANDARHTRG